MYTIKKWTTGIMTEVDPVWVGPERLHPLESIKIVKPPSEQLRIIELGKRVSSNDLRSVTAADVESMLAKGVSRDEFRAAMLAMKEQNMYESVLQSTPDATFAAAAKGSVREYCVVAEEGLRSSAEWFLSVIRSITDDHRGMCARVNSEKIAQNSGVW